MVKSALGATARAQGTESVGARLRERRLALRLTLRQVADRAGLSEGFVSQLERGVHSGSIATLQKITAVLGLDVGDVFTWDRSPAVLRFTDQQGFAFGESGRKVRLTPKQFHHLEAFLGVFEAGGSTGVEPYSHGDSEELLFVVSGEVEVTVGAAVHHLSALDSITYSSSEPHRVKESAGGTATVLWAMAPPSY
ncbi:helix-turn-helix domain-containing protein [Saccharopolyspora sp. ASAGF58]|uniref:helix-turn-helix domain-containing protein n=1 Tax=Saccharopolyspora sp. ASAGF58 TaxID=2719023 RepID=UPI00143FC943|nr:XRE family transcriptional regulator [Saccharopolyspora sp. ASAGF58]QIZ37250.1 cupin domain-containing protein [Saccharopolyspora sp. ASAGF58]